jgi:hypothetical protein
MMLRQKAIILLAANTLLALLMARAQTMPSVTVSNANDSLLEIVPVDGIHDDSLPPSLRDLLPDLPPGSFLLKNNTSIPITVIVAKWMYTDKSGNEKQLSIHCDAYLVTRTEPLVNAHDSSLVTPDSCARQEYFSRLRTQSFMGSPLYSARNSALVATKENLTHTSITLDSVIFADGQIWGPDNLHYYKTIMERTRIRQFVVDEFVAAKESGESLSAHISAIKAEGMVKKDKISSARRYYATLLEGSPNPEGTLRSLQQQQALPEFHHIGGQK